MKIERVGTRVRESSKLSQEEVVCIFWVEFQCPNCNEIVEFYVDIVVPVPHLQQNVERRHRCEKCKATLVVGVYLASEHNPQGQQKRSSVEYVKIEAIEPDPPINPYSTDSFAEGVIAFLLTRVPIPRYQNILEDLGFEGWHVKRTEVYDDQHDFRGDMMVFLREEIGQLKKSQPLQLRDTLIAIFNTVAKYAD